MRRALISLSGHVDSVERVRSQLLRLEPMLTFDLVVGVDGGCKLLSRLNLSADLILGDFDSVVRVSSFESLWPKAKVLTFPAEKDMTDAELAFDYVNETDIDEAIVIGGTGGRLDHALSVLFLAGHFRKAVLVDEQNIIWPFKAPFNREINLDEVAGDYVSLIPMEKTLEGVTLRGFKYPLASAVISPAQTLGVSNELVSKKGTIQVDRGEGLLIFSKD